MALKDKTTATYGFRQVDTINTNGVVTGSVYTTGLLKTLETVGNVYSVNSKNRRLPNPHRFSVVNRTYWTGTSMTLRPNGTPSQIVSGLQSKAFATSSPPPMSFSNSAYNRALSDLNEKVRGSLDIAIDLTQWRQVVDMINIRKKLISKMATTLNGLTERVDRLDRFAKVRVRRLANRKRSRDIRHWEDNSWYRYRARQLAGELAQRRLEFVYGWAPLAGSLCDLGEEFSDPSTPWNSYQVIKARGVDRAERSVSVGAAEKRHLDLRYRCMISIALKPPNDVLTAQASRISSLNPISIVYENIPFSFVVDWFYDIGSWLRDTETAFINSNRFDSGFISEGSMFVEKMQEVQKTPTSLIVRSAEMNTKSFKRTVLSSYPFPRPPTFKPVLGDSRLLNAAALLQVNSSRIDQFIMKWR